LPQCSSHPQRHGLLRRRPRWASEPWRARALGIISAAPIQGLALGAESLARTSLLALLRGRSLSLLAATSPRPYRVTAAMAVLFVSPRRGIAVGVRPANYRAMPVDRVMCRPAAYLTGVGRCRRTQRSAVGRFRIRHGAIRVRTLDIRLVEMLVVPSMVRGKIPAREDREVVAVLRDNQRTQTQEAPIEIARAEIRTRNAAKTVPCQAEQFAHAASNAIIGFRR